MNNKTILITGADGFIGSHLVEFLYQKGLNIKALCFYNSIGSWGWLESIPNEIKENIEIIMGDVRDPGCVNDAVKGCFYVFHLASLIGIPYSYKAPHSYIETNVVGTLNVLEAVKKYEVHKLIHTSTSETYGTAKRVPINEEHPLNSQSPYAASKVSADQLALSYWRSFQTPIAIIRPFNTYGPRQSSRAVIPTIIGQIATGNSSIKLGALSPTRDFNYVEDICSAFWEIAKSDNTYGEIINAASNFEISIGDTAKLIGRIMDSEINIVADSIRNRPENSEVYRLYGDNSKLKELTSWEPKYAGINGLRKGLKKTIEWFSIEENLSFYKTNLYMF